MRIKLTSYRFHHRLSTLGGWFIGYIQHVKGNITLS